MKKELALAGAASALLAMAAIGVGGAEAGADKITICHGTASLTNPYVEITVSMNATKDGHFDGIPDPSHGELNAPDFVLEEGRTCADGPGGGGGES
jgi:hypothetical protein